ncbi:tRNA (adenosine(37)-N6)-dimethylallyltransferase MiaA [Spiribacter sp. 2438]|uniref:tRNA (adenosine(37)-N6)-dimethylallyltransferase MiaA n=1 Tax=Spiribacter sp. 2438 TaxID=2666185 RepID=UPI0012B0DCF8|nr:tRNA (adenosine(37)-N6)-dimethylallyltransferase MiaA [Spiribacter sp. 2438]QGM21280.1 tRNA (adenosine(37)-N6)-dimethylallyltransferase MiaA [Spiribacter sp. 2438]
MGSVPANPPVVCIMGPTAAGKTDLALELHARGGMDLISVDSAMVYRGMDIGTAKPSPAVQRQAPHGLVDIRDPQESYSAAEFAADARGLIQRSRQAGRIPLLVGGTMLYFRALAQGLSPLPSADAALRRSLEAEAADRGWPALHQRLKQVDPATARRLHPNDSQRIQRALEVFTLTGQPLSDLHNHPAPEPLGGPLVYIGVAPASREFLYQRIEQRFAGMLEKGLVEEVTALRRRPGIHEHLPSMRAVGYRQVWDFLEGRVDRSDLRFRGVVATRQFARRQMTWLRRTESIRWVDGTGPGALKRLREQLADVVD